MIDQRPDFSSFKSFADFQKYYWYRKELSNICKNLGIDNSGTKAELLENIKQYFDGNIIKKSFKKKFSESINFEDITIETPLLKCGFCFNQSFRNYFSEITNVDKFKFNANMVTAWRKVKQEEDYSFTIKDMLDIYYKKSDYAKYDNSSCQWNKFLKDFCQDERNKIFYNKIKVASILWKIIRESSYEKVYSYELVESNFEIIKDYKLTK